MLDELVSMADDRSQNRCVVRLRTSSWADQNGITTTKKLTFLKRQCRGFNILKEDASDISAQEVIDRITNLDTCSDGVYEVVTCDEGRDWETGYIDEYNYKLILFVE